MQHDSLWLCAAVLLAAVCRPTMRERLTDWQGTAAQPANGTKVHMLPMTSLPKRTHVGKVKVSGSSSNSSSSNWISSGQQHQDQQQWQHQDQQVQMQQSEQDQERGTTPEPIACRDSNGAAVDWFIALKLPVTTQPPQAGNRGLRYCYVASNSNRWRCHDDIRAEEGPIYNTVSQALVYNRRPGDLVGAYNDFVPGETGSHDNFGHMRGLMMIRNRFDRDVGSGFWLLHSVRHFPSLSEFSYPSSGILYGQSFLCMSFDRSEFYPLKDLIFKSNPHMYFPKFRLPASANSEVVNGFKAFLNGHEFRYFAKVNSPDVDIFESAATRLQTPLHVQTWNDTRQGGSTCNILGVRLPHGTFKSSVDHSKWCVSGTRHSRRWVCVGDLNRHTKRNGGLMCLNSDKAHQLLLDSVLLRCN